MVTITNMTPLTTARCGAEEWKIPATLNRVGMIRSGLKAVANIAPDAMARIGGRFVPEHAVVYPGQTVEFVKLWGHKGAGDAPRKLTAKEVYYGSNAGATRSFLAALEKHGHIGRIAAALFRAQKASTRAKKYRGGIRHSDGGKTSFTELSYDRKDTWLKRLCDLLAQDACDMAWGWGVDHNQPAYKRVLYVDLHLDGQVSFHSRRRLRGPKYRGRWDGKDETERRIIDFCQLVADGFYDGLFDRKPS